MKNIKLMFVAIIMVFLLSINITGALDEPVVCEDAEQILYLEFNGIDCFQKFEYPPYTPLLI